ncbi:MAG: arginine--tRNA ligase [Deltaproteobacteria bacterium]|nr:arginine--tRNA ligase [Deltaproteobacteria bacterium]
MKNKLRRALLGALTRACQAGDLPPVEDLPAFNLENPRQAEHGDLAANLAMQLGKPCRKKPRDIADILVRHLGDAGGLLTRVEVAGPGFLNLFIRPGAWFEGLNEILTSGPDYGRGDWGGGVKVLLEFVSANPTGPLHVGHGRGAVLGDTLARLLAFSGHAVDTEYYINDAGNQMATLGRSVLARAREIEGSTEPFPDNHYRGDYIKDIARELLAQRPDLTALDPEVAVPLATDYAGGVILEGIKEDLAAFQVSFTRYYSERTLVEGGAVERGFQALRERDYLYEDEGALWFRATDFGDEKDRVVRRGNGETTYFASDIAYHLDKFARGYGRLIDIWGADHHGYIARVKAAIQGLDHAPEDLDVLLVQMVNLLRAGEPVAMSTRSGEFVTLKEVVDEVGSDSARFIFLTRRSDAQLDFDLEVAKEKSLDNPVYYVQYAHTRVAAVRRKAAEQGFTPPAAGAADLSRLGEDKEIDLAKRLNQFAEAVESAARNLEPHRLTYYLTELAGAFHSYYNSHQILVPADPALAGARFTLAGAVGQVLANGLGLLGVAAPESM